MKKHHKTTFLSKISVLKITIFFFNRCTREKIMQINFSCIFSHFFPTFLVKPITKPKKPSLAANILNKVVSNYTNNAATLGNEIAQKENKSLRKSPDRIVSEREILYYRSRKLGT